jgi:hypothetical protein
VAGVLLWSNLPAVTKTREREGAKSGEEESDRRDPPVGEREGKEVGELGCRAAVGLLPGLGPGCGPVGLGTSLSSSFLFCFLFFLFLFSALVFELARLI